MKKKLNGLTLMELLVAITMSALVIAGLGAIFAGTIKVWSKVQDSTSALKSGMVVVNWIIRDLKEGLIADAKEDEITFENGIRYCLDKDTLKRNTDVVSLEVEKIKFTYFDKNGNPEKDLDKISFVSFSLTVKDRNHTLDLNSGANLRNAKWPELSI